MMGSNDEPGWQKTKLNTVVRYRNRGKYDYETVHQLIDKCPLLHISFGSAGGAPNDDELASYPVILPMLGCTGCFPPREEWEDDGSRYIYLHGYVSSRFFRKTAPPRDEESSTEQTAKTRVCVSATFLDGIVMALTPNHHSCNYRSVVAFGHATLVENQEERLYAMELITNNLVPERWQNTRYPSSAELKATGIIRIEVDSASAKIRTGTTGEARSDLQDEEMKKKVWAGVVPVYTVYGDPVPAPTSTFNGVPSYIEDWAREMTDESERYAYAASEK
ncbi:hypothetical protein DV736_g6152, partial [Chaetothyriales sp. CBS 134916]